MPESQDTHADIVLSEEIVTRVAERLTKRYARNGVIVLSPNGAWRDLVASEIRAGLLSR